jgi:hypothetical protein
VLNRIELIGCMLVKIMWGVVVHNTRRKAICR